MLIMTLIAKLSATKTLAKPIALFVGVAARAGSFMVVQGKHLVRARRNRSQVRLLSELTPRDLKDIGLIPSDVTGALAVRWSDDPSSVLVMRRPVPVSLLSAAPLPSRLRSLAPVTPAATRESDITACDDICLSRSA